MEKKSLRLIIHLIFMQIHIMEVIPSNFRITFSATSFLPWQATWNAENRYDVYISTSQPSKPTFASSLPGKDFFNLLQAAWNRKSGVSAKPSIVLCVTY